MCTVDHAIEIEECVKPPLRHLYQLSPVELVVVKDYVVDLLRQGSIRRSKSPLGASLFFVKDKRKLRAVVDYRALNRIAKRNNTPLPRPDEMSDRLGEAGVFSKLDLKTGFHQIRVRPEDIENSFQYQVRSVRILSHAYGTLQCTGDFPDINEPDILRLY